MTEAEVLNKAADLIDEAGWWDGKGDQGSKVCAAIAINTVVEPEESFGFGSQAFGYFERFLGIPTGLYGSVAEWNDFHTKDEVTAALRAAAKSVTA